MIDPASSQLSMPIPLTEADVEAVANLYRRCAAYFLLQDGEAPTLVDAHALFTDVPPEKAQDDQFVWGWKGGDGLAAVAAILRDYPVAGTWYLGFMIVDAAARGRGIGRAIYATVEDHAREGRAGEIRLAVLEGNSAGERFWRSLGFRERRRVADERFKARTHCRVELVKRLAAG